MGDRSRGPGHVARRTSVRITGDAVFKSGYADLDAEAEKARALYEISLQSSFIAPRVLGVSSADATISFEFLPGLVSIREMYLATCRGDMATEAVTESFTAAGEVLARIHAGLQLSHTVEWRPSIDFEADLRRESCLDALQVSEIAMPVILHGDYGFANTFASGNDPSKLVILDSSPNGFTTFSPIERGPRGIDVANMIACIQGLVPVRSYPFLDWSRARNLAEAFLGGYESVGHCRLPRKSLYSMARATARTYLRYRYRWTMQRELAYWVFFWSRKRDLLHHD